MKLMQSVNGLQHYICDESSVLRINGKIFYINIEDIINAYSDSAIYRCEEQLYTSLIHFKCICICNFSSAEHLKEQMIEYLI